MGYSAGLRAGAETLRAVRHSSKLCTTAKNGGTNSTARQVDASMPVNTVIPIDTRALAPAPLASTSGTTPRMKANDVITIGRKRARAASGRGIEDRLAGGAQFARELHNENRVLCRERHQQNEPDLNVEIVAEPALDERRERQSPMKDSGTARMTETGAYQLSYWPASTR